MNSHKSRYPFAPLAEGVYFFITDNSCYYTVTISNSHDKFTGNSLLLNHGEVFEIGFDRTCDGEPRFDETVGNTILYIMATNIAAKGDTAVYFFVCDTMDGDGELRARLFNLWYLQIKRMMPHLQKHNFVVKGFDEDKFEISLLLFDNHPNCNDYVAAFETSLNENFTKG